MLTRVQGPREARIFTRNGNDWTDRFKTLQAELIAARLPTGWYDGEIVILDAEGKPNFNALQLAIEGKANAEIVYYLFDAPYMRGLDMRRVPVETRRELLKEALHETEILRFSNQLDGPAEHLLPSACKLGLEGIVGKRRGSFYVNRRTDDWIKLRCTSQQEFVIGGYLPSASSRIAVGALLVGVFDAQGVLQYAGKVGTGFSSEVAVDLRRRLDAIARSSRPFASPTGHDKQATWAEPSLVCDVCYKEWPKDGHLRHASFKGLRRDKPAKEVTRESAKASPAAPASASGAAAAAVRVTHPDRVVDPSTGFCKRDVVGYYAVVAEWMLPHFTERPVHLVRAPGGIEGEVFFQKHHEGLVGLRALDAGLWPGHDPLIAIDTAKELLTAAQLSTIEFHTWNSTTKAIDRPDRVIFDLDPGDGVLWARMQEAAHLTRAMLRELQLESWLKTTGGKGLHVVVPLAPALDYDTVKLFSQAVVQHLARTFPDRFVAKSGSSNRVGKVFIDYLRNGRGQTTAAAFSARARPGLGVSMPVSWDELQELERGSQWSIATAPAYLASRRKDPWAGYWKLKQKLTTAMSRLGLRLNPAK